MDIESRCFSHQTKKLGIFKKMINTTNQERKKKRALDAINDKITEFWEWWEGLESLVVCPGKSDYWG